MKRHLFGLAIALVLLSACGSVGMRGFAENVRGIADKRTDFRKFTPMSGDPGRFGLKAVNPYFKRANRAQILRAIESACRDTGRPDAHKRGSSVLNPAAGSGYYVNCNPENRQLLNGYVPASQSQAPHSH